MLHISNEEVVTQGNVILPNYCRKSQGKTEASQQSNDPCCLQHHMGTLESHWHNSTFAICRCQLPLEDDGFSAYPTSKPHTNAIHWQNLNQISVVW